MIVLIKVSNAHRRRRISPSEADHELVWMPFDEALTNLVEDSQRRALEIFLQTKHVWPMSRVCSFLICAIVMTVGLAVEHLSCFL